MNLWLQCDDVDMKGKTVFGWNCVTLLCHWRYWLGRNAVAKGHVKLTRWIQRTRGIRPWPLENVKPLLLWKRLRFYLCYHELVTLDCTLCWMLNTIMRDGNLLRQGNSLDPVPRLGLFLSILHKLSEYPSALFCWEDEGMGVKTADFRECYYYRGLSDVPQCRSICIIYRLK